MGSKEKKEEKKKQLSEKVLQGNTGTYGTN